MTLVAVAVAAVVVAVGAAPWQQYGKDATRSGNSHTAMFVPGPVACLRLQGLVGALALRDSR